MCAGVLAGRHMQEGFEFPPLDGPISVGVSREEGGPTMVDSIWKPRGRRGSGGLAWRRHPLHALSAGQQKRGGHSVRQRDCTKAAYGVLRLEVFVVARGAPRCCVVQGRPCRECTVVGSTLSCLLAPVAARLLFRGYRRHLEAPTSATWGAPRCGIAAGGAAVDFLLQIAAHTDA